MTYLDYIEASDDEHEPDFLDAIEWELAAQAEAHPMPFRRLTAVWQAIDGLLVRLWR